MYERGLHGNHRAYQTHWHVEPEEPMPQELRDQLIGDWKLVAYVEEPVDGSESFELLGPDP